MTDTINQYVMPKMPGVKEMVTTGHIQEIRPSTLNLVSNFAPKFSVRTAQKDGRPHLVVPIVALIEGVHCGMMGGETACLFYPSNEISDTVQNWNGIPLTAFHPEINGKLVAVEQALKPFKIGTFENVRFEAGVLTGEGWVDIALAQSISPETLQMIRARTNMEVSTGLGLLGDQKEGTWNGESFDQSVFDFKPDHLALLPGGEGACSIADGCGVIMNTKKECGSCKLNIKGGEKNVKERMLAFENHLSKEGDTSAERWPLLVINDVVTQLKREGFRVNELSHGKLREKLTKIVNDMDKPGIVHFLGPEFKDRFIFEKFRESENDTKLFRQAFSITKDDQIKIKGDAVEVEEKLTFPDVIKANNKEEKNMANSKKVIAALIANEKLPQFTKEDEAWFEEMEDKHFNKIAELNDCKCNEALEEALTVANQKVADNETVIKKMSDELTANESKSKEKENHIPTFEEVVNSAPVDMQEALQDGMRMSKEKRGKLVDALVANDRCTIAKERLESKKTNELEELVSLGNIPVDHSLKGNGGQKIYGANEKHPDGTGVPLVQNYADWK